MATWTKAQTQAIQHRQGNVLISAGAGSGKTMVLTQRVLAMVVEEGIPLDRLLILTFTNAAATSMKERIRKAFLNKQKYHEATQVDQAYIMTFDAFALFLVKKYHQVLGVDANVGIYEETLYEIAKRVHLEQIFTEGYERKYPSFVSLIKQFVINSDESLKKFILKIDQKADLKPNKDLYYKTYVDEHFEPAFIQEKLQVLLAHYRHEIHLIERQATLFKVPEQTEIFTQICRNLIQLPTLDDLLMGLKTLVIPPLKRNSLDEEDKALREKLKKDLKSFQAMAEMVPTANQVQRYEDTKPFVEIILTMLLELNKRLNQEKKATNRYPFSDIAKMATSLFQHDAIATQLKSQFLYIMVDEYQDTNDLQETFLQALVQDNLFMVGDIKQSIYRFRNANSEIFNDKLTRYTPYDQSKDGYNTVINLNQNFRSRPEVLASINDVFAFIMNPQFGGVHYHQEHQLDFGQTLYETHRDPKMDYHMQVVRYNTEALDKEKHEPRIIAQDIKEKILAKVQVVDDHTHQLRDITYRDFAILIDRKTNFENFIEVFNEAGIPLDVFAERDLSDSDFFRVMKNLIGYLLHVQAPKDVKPNLQLLVSVLRSFLFQVSDEDIHAYVFQQKPLSESPLYPLDQKMKALLHSLTLSQWMHRLMKELNIEEKLLTLPDLPSNLARLQGLMIRVKQLSEMGYTVSKFYTFLQQSKEIEVDLTITAQKETDNAVQLMTIHKSKGLEFPYVYYPGLTKGFNMMEVKGMYHVSMKYGIQLPYPEAVYAKPLFADLILNEESEAILSEQVRLFYVALTRAKEKIILVLESSKEKKLVDMDRARSFSDFVHLYALARHRDISKDHWVPLPANLSQSSQVKVQGEPLQVTFKQIHSSFDMIQPRRASKALTDNVDDALLHYGTYLHECMFLLDFATMDTRFIPIEADRLLIEKVIQTPFFQSLQQQVKNKQVTVQKEYAFYDEENQRKGIIDLLVMQGQSVTIVDYKTANIDDPLYAQQLRTYAAWLSRQGFLIHELILVSLVQGATKFLPMNPTDS